MGEKHAKHTSCCQPADLTAAAEQNADTHAHHADAHAHQHAVSTNPFIPAIISFILLALGLLMDHVYPQTWFSGLLRFSWYLVAYIPVGIPVLKDAWFSIRKGNFFSEFFLMGIATIGAFAIGEYPEGVAVMLFYAVGENFQHMAVTRARANIKALLDQRPDEASILIDQQIHVVPAASIQIGQLIQLKPGEKLALDGFLTSAEASFNTSALTGESKPATKRKGDPVLAGMINLGTVAMVEVSTAYADSKLSKILALVQDASKRKAPTELFIARFAKKYTPVVVCLAVGITFLPYFFVQEYLFQAWLYKALVFLVLSCPCALVISIPLGYFGGIGAASRNGILIKGGNYLDLLAEIKHVVMDKTGTLTAGVFEVQAVNWVGAMPAAELLPYVHVLESKSTHPVATAIHQYVGPVDPSLLVSDISEIPGMGLRGMVRGKPLLVGNFRLLDRYAIPYAAVDAAGVYSLIAVAYDDVFQGYLTIADRLKEDAAATVAQLHAMGITLTMLSGDKDSVVQDVARKLQVDEAFGDLLPEDKVTKLNAIKSRDLKVAFVGDGVNDAPVVALSDVGIAMGGLGSDATIETADVVIQDDKPSKIPMAIRIAKKTKQIVWQNISLAFAVKALVLILGAGGIASMWEAVFADVGVALLAILNAIRIQRGKY